MRTLKGADVDQKLKILGVDLAASKNGFRFESIPNLLHSLSLVGVGGALAFAMEVAEFAIVQIASSLTLSIIGVTKVSTKAMN